MPDVPPTSRKARPHARLTADQWWRRAREAGWAGSPNRAISYSRRALRLLATDGSERQLHVRILLTMSYQLSELGDIAGAMDALAGADKVSPQDSAAIHSARGILLAKIGRNSEALEQFELAVVALEGSDSLDYATTLLNRGTLHMAAGRLAEAFADTDRAYQVSKANGHEAMEFMAQHNLGYIEFLAGNLPDALDSMARASRRAPSAALGVPELDRARVLMASGLFSEAQEAVERALQTFVHHKAETDLVDALLVSAELALLQGNRTTARRQAHRAETISLRRGHGSAALVAKLLALRADALAFDPGRSTHVKPPTKTRVQQAAVQADDLARQLRSAGLDDDARTASLVLAEARLYAGDLAGAGHALVEAGYSRRKPNLGIRLHTKLVSARLAISSGAPQEGLSEISKGLEDLAEFQARFGSQDMQAAAAVHGGALARTGLRTAVATGDPAVILPWLERSRAATTRLPVIRPPTDPELITRLAQLRMTVRTAREATLAGKPDPALQREITETRAMIRARTWTTAGGQGRAHRPISLTAVQRLLREQEPDTTVLAYFHGAGKIHALVVTARHAHYRVLGERHVLEHRLSRLNADLDLLAAPRMAGPLRAVAVKSLRAGLAAVADQLVDPIADLWGSGRIRLAVVGRLGTAPWSLVPGFVGRPVSVTASVTTALAADPDPVPAHTRGVLAVAGPDVRGGESEVLAVHDLHPGAIALTGADATGEAVLKYMPDRGLLHIAAHGHHVPESPLFSAVLLHDGPLFGYDIAPNPALPDHVVLSSCDVGQSADRPGGEPLGLAAALLRSGVRTVVAGTSRISDTVAATVMTTYHDRLLAGAVPAAALADAIVAAGDDPAPLTCFGA